MLPIRRILVAINDLRPTSRPIVRKAAQIALACKAQVELYHCLSNRLYLDVAADGPRSIREMEMDMRQDALRKLERIAAVIRGPHLKVSTAAEWDSPAYDAIIRRARKMKADLVIASGHSGPHLLPVLMRLTDWELVRLSPVPVLLVKNSRPYRRPTVLVAVDPGHAFSKPLRLDTELLRAGAALSHSLRGSLHAVHAYNRIALGPATAGTVNERTLRQAERRAKLAAQAHFNRALTGSHIARSRRYLIGRHPVDAILQAARKSRSAIVVMGAISRTGFKRLLIGNTAETILDELRCDTLIVKPRHFKTRVPRAVQGPRIIMPPPEPWLGNY